MVALKIEFSKRKKDQAYWQALDRQKVMFAVFNLPVPGPDFKTERDMRLEMFRDYVEQGFRVWNIKRRKGTK